MHSAILSTCIKLPFVIKICVLSIFEWPLKTGFTVFEAQWLSGRVLDSTPRGRGFEPHRRHCVVVLEQDIYHSLVLFQPRKTRHSITERVLMGRKESNQTNKHTVLLFLCSENTDNRGKIEYN